MLHSILNNHGDGIPEGKNLTDNLVSFLRNYIITKRLYQLIYYIIYAPVFLILFPVYSCMTTSVQTVNSQDFLIQKDSSEEYKILGIYFKDGKYKSYRETETKYFAVFDGKYDVIIYEKGFDTVWTGTNSYKIMKYTEIIELKDIFEMEVEFTRQKQMECSNWRVT